MQNISIVPITALGRAEDGRIHICTDTSDIYLIEDSADILIEVHTRVVLLDTVKNGSITVNALPDSHVEYIVLDSENTQRSFTVSGELHLLEIALRQTREQLNINLMREGAQAFVKCLCIASEMKSSFTQYISHQSVQTVSDISNVGISMKASDVLFDTTGKVEKAMAGSKCRQLSRGIVMDDSSSVTAKPILLIDEYDCFANHGASIGKMSDEDLFYLMSRGLNKNEAFFLILQGILKPYISSIPTEEWKNKIEQEVSKLIEK